MLTSFDWTTVLICLTWASDLRKRRQKRGDPKVTNSTGKFRTKSWQLGDHKSWQQSLVYHLPKSGHRLITTKPVKDKHCQGCWPEYSGIQCQCRNGAVQWSPVAFSQCICMHISSVKRNETSGSVRKSTSVVKEGNPNNFAMPFFFGVWRARNQQHMRVLFWREYITSIRNQWKPHKTGISALSQQNNSRFEFLTCRGGESIHLQRNIDFFAFVLTDSQECHRPDKKKIYVWHLLCCSVIWKVTADWCSEIELVSCHVCRRLEPK